MDTVSIKEWVQRGEGLMVNAYSLSIKDPDHAYNQILAQGKRPEDFGMKHPYAEEFEHMSRDELILEIIELREENMAIHRAAAGGWI